MGVINALRLVNHRVGHCLWLVEDRVGCDLSLVWWRTGFFLSMEIAQHLWEGKEVHVGVAHGLNLGIL